LIEPARRKRPRKRKKSKKWLGLGMMLLVVLLIVGGVWMYFSGQFSKLSDEYEQNPVVGQVGILDIENPQQAELSLHQVVGTRVTPQIPLEGTRALLRRGDYYVEARRDSQVVRFPVYLKGRGHQIQLEVEFPPPSPPGTDVAYIPAGWFRMGNKETTVAHFGFPDETPDIDVYVSGFFLAQYEVTNREFAEFIEAGGYENEVYWERLLQDWSSLLEQVPAYEQVYGNDGWDSVRQYIHAQFVDTDDRPGPRLWEADTPPYEYGQDDHPVIGITMYEAAAYCQWMTQKTGKLHRLPTEAEWEKAARGYEGYLFSYGNEYNPTRANTESEGPKNVGSYPPNSYEVYDLTGNVWEWVSDHYNSKAYQIFLDTYRNEIRNPRMVNETHRYDRVIVRGGSFRSVNRINARTPVRYPMFPNYWHTNIGFRYVVVP
jgi:formylglycine-generating enzyme required for sulfatase activity